MIASKKSKWIAYMSVLLLVICTLFLGACQDKEVVSYKNEKYGFSMDLPKAFADAAEIKENEKIIYFINKEIQEVDPSNIFGVVGRIEVYDKKEFTKDDLKQNEEAYALVFLGENEKYYFGWANATDIQFQPNASEQLKEKFREMESEFREIIKTFKISQDV